MRRFLVGPLALVQQQLRKYGSPRDIDDDGWETTRRRRSEDDWDEASNSRPTRRSADRDSDSRPRRSNDDDEAPRGPPRGGGGGARDDFDDERPKMSRREMIETCDVEPLIVRSNGRDVPCGRSVNVQGLPPSVGWKDVKDFFSERVGGVTFCRIFPPRADQIDCAAVIEFETPDQAKVAVEEGDGGFFYEDKIRISPRRDDVVVLAAKYRRFVEQREQKLKELDDRRRLQREAKERADALAAEAAKVKQEEEAARGSATTQASDNSDRPPGNTTSPTN